MKVGLIYYTPDYHKLVEMTARECYQSYHKVSPDSHGFIRGIMGKGHVSIASVGNIVFGVADFTGLEEFNSVCMDLLTMKEINNYIRWTLPNMKKNPDSKVGIVISMNILTFLDILNKIDEYEMASPLFELMKKNTDKKPILRWFYDPAVELVPSENTYVNKPEPELYKPVVLTSDYQVLKEKGLNEYELDIHSTVTVNIKTSRDSVLQMWRHADMTGGTELSQRYVDRSNAEIRRLIGFEKGEYPDSLEEYAKKQNLSTKEAKDVWDAWVDSFYVKLESIVESYSRYKEDFISMGMRQGRAKEIARAMLPNAITTKTIQCRPLRQWKHFFNLRDSVHAQPEIRKDAQALKEAFRAEGIEI